MVPFFASWWCMEQSNQSLETLFWWADAQLADELPKRLFNECRKLFGSECNPHDLVLKMRKSWSDTGNFRKKRDYDNLVYLVAEKFCANVAPVEEYLVNEEKLFNKFVLDAVDDIGDSRRQRRIRQLLSGNGREGGAELFEFLYSCISDPARKEHREYYGKGILLLVVQLLLRFFGGPDVLARGFNGAAIAQLLGPNYAFLVPAVLYISCMRFFMNKQLSIGSS